MEIGPIFRALFHNKARFWLLTLEIALTLAVVANCLNVILDYRAKAQRDTGMDVESLLVVTSEPFAPDFEDDDYVEASEREDLRTLEAIPGVQAVFSTTQIPLSGSGSATGRRAVGTDGQGSTAPYFVVTQRAIEALGVELVAGRDFVDSDYPPEVEGQDNDTAAEEASIVRERNVIITQALADVLFPDGDALGRQIEPRDSHELNTIVGIVAHMHGSWPTSNVFDRVMLIPGTPANDRRARYIVRTEPGMLDDLYTGVEERLLQVNDGRILSVRTMQEIKDGFYGDLAAVNKMFGALATMLVIVTSLGIIGMTSFSVAQRRKQIGTRRALGASRGAILRYFLVENWVMTSIGLTVGVLLTYSLNYALAQFADTPRIEWTLVVWGMLLLWALGIAAALAPALRSTMVQPVVATQNV